ncbi:hypothetical protein [Sphingobacterium kyonggiense]
MKIAVLLLSGLFLLPFSSKSETTVFPVINKSKVDSSINENEELIMRIAENHLLEDVYREIFGLQFASTVQWLNIIGQNVLTSFSNSDYFIMENNRSGGFEIYDDENNFLSVAPDLNRNYSLETNSGIWVKQSYNGFNKTYFATNSGEEYTMLSKFSLGTRNEIKCSNGYSVLVKGKLNGNYDISDNEGRKWKIIYNRSGIIKLYDGDRLVKTLVIQSQQSFTLQDGNGNSTNIRTRGRFNDIIITYPDGKQIFVENRYKKPVPPPKVETKTEAKPAG